MKRRWQVFVKDYLTFSLKDRIGLLIITLLIIAVYLAPRFIIKPAKAVNTEVFQQELAHLKIYIDSSSNRTSRRQYNDEDDDHYTPRVYEPRSANAMLFEFDPNTLDAAGWERLGVRKRTVETIMKLTGKGFKFKNPEDLKRIYGLKEEDADRLIPFVRIKTRNPEEPAFAPAITAKTPYTIKENMVIDINQADTTAFKALPGIGSKLAGRIVTFRDKLGGFHTVDQVAETYALPDSVFQKIKPRLMINEPGVKKISINVADVNQLKAHPYIRWNIANAIVAYRQQHGPYKQANDVKKIAIVTDEIFEKMAPYLSVAMP